MTRHLVFPLLAGALAAQNPQTPQNPQTQPTPRNPQFQDPAPAPAPKPVDWKDLTKSGLPIRFYGFFRLDAYYNTARMDSVVIPTRVLSEATNADDNQFTLDPRLTRFGFDLVDIKTDAGTVSGKLETDFANFPTGTTESRATPRIRLAYMDVRDEDLGARMGQDWDVISPLLPSVNSETLMWNAGNLGDRRPQIQGRWAPKDGAVDLKVALGLTGAINNQDLDTGAAAGERDGFDSGMPHLQARLGWKGGSFAEGKSTQAGFWGAYGMTETDTRFGGENHFDIFCGGIDLQLPLTEELQLRGEGWIGQNLGDFRGGIGQTINTTTGEEIEAAGGWVELVYAVSKKTQIHVGSSLDDPKNEDLAGLTTNPAKRNHTVYAGTMVDWSTGIRTGFDAIWWTTDYVGTSNGDGIRFDLYFQFNF